MIGKYLTGVTSGEAYWRAAMIEWDVDFSDTQRRYIVLVDLGDETVVLTREMLADMLNSLDEAETSA